MSIVDYLQYVPQPLINLLMLFVVFGGLAKLMPCNSDQKFTAKAYWVDMGYYFVIPIFTRFIQTIYIVIGAGLLFHGESSETVANYIMHGWGPQGKWPLWVQAAIAFVLSDVILYWIHRGFHGVRMWRYHAIHHSTKNLDWHSTYRFHPINVWLSFTLVDVIMALSGLSMQSILAMGMFNMFYSGMVHANLNWTFGPFKYVFASPVFHRWHHTFTEEGGSKNFAPTFPILDIIFGTFYMPKGKLPEKYGINEEIPESFVEQLYWPYKKNN